jgi:hypothetical protein
MKKFESLGLTTVLAVSAAVLGACDKDNGWDSAQQPTRVCVDAQGHRVPEDQCARPHAGGVSPFLWYYLGTLNRGYGVPGYGGLVGGGSFRAAPGTAYGFAPASGISRGGFGGTAGSFGGAGEGAGE